MEVFERIGVLVDDQDVLKLLDEAGAHVDTKKRIAKVPEYLVEEGVRKSPSTFILNSRGKHRYRVGGDKTYTSTDGGALWMLDLRTGEHRPSTKRDLEETSRLVDGLDNIDIYEPMVFLHDVDNWTLDVQATEAVFRNTSKPCRLLTHESKYLMSVIDLAAIVAGGMEELEKNPIFCGGASPTSPLMLKNDEIVVTRKLAEHSIPNAIMPCPISGTSAPISVAGTLVILNTEMLSLLLIAELTNPGTPVAVGYGGPTVVDMRNGFASMGSPQAALLTAGCIDIARRYNLPTWVTAFHTDSPVPDAQAAYESTWNSFLPLMGHASVALGAGCLNADVGASCEKLIIDNEICGGLRSIVQGIHVSERTLGLEVIESVGPGGDFLAQKHTRELFREEHWFPTISSRMNLREWQKKGQDVWSRAREEATKILTTHQPEPLEKEKVKMIAAYVKEAERKAPRAN
jgi:trimethylamine--corrinoid protein Co-methyltransferase